MKDVLVLAKELLSSFFERKSDEAIGELLTDDVLICGLPGEKNIKGIEQTKRYFSDLSNKYYTSATLSYEKENRISDSNFYLEFSLTNEGVTVHFSVSGFAIKNDEYRRLSFLHFSLNDTNQSEGLFQKIVQKRAEEKSEYRLIHEILHKMQGGLYTYIFDEANHNVIFVDSSYENDTEMDSLILRYDKHNDKGGMILTHPEDRERVWSYLSQAVHTGNTTFFKFRDINEEWFNVTCTAYGQRDGLPLVRVLFTKVSIFYDLELQALEMDGMAIFIIDEDTDELYFVNDSAFKLFEIEPCNIHKMKCHQLFWDCKERCQWCCLNRDDVSESSTSTFETQNGKALSVSMSKKQWNGRNVFIVCLRDITKEHALHTKVKEAHRNMQDLVGNLPSAVCLYRWDGRKLKRLLMGHGYEELCGSEAAGNAKIGQGINQQIVYPDDLKSVQNFADKFLNSGHDEKGSIQYRIWNGDRKEYIWITAHGKLVQQKDGTALLYAIYTDETKQVEIKNELAATRNAVNIAMEYGRIGIWTYDLTTKMICQNISDVGSYGLKTKSSFTKDWIIEQKIINEDDVENYKHCYQLIDEGAQKSDCLVRVLNQETKEYRWVHLFLVRQPIAKDTNPTAIGMCFDINSEITNYEKLVKAQLQLKQEKQVIDNLFENLPGGVALFRWNGEKLNSVYVSNGLSDLYGEEGKAVLERYQELIFDVVHPDDLPALKEFILSNINKVGQNLIYRYRVWNKKLERYIWIQVTGKIMNQLDGSKLIYTNYADIDAEVKISEELKKEEKLLETTCRLANIYMFQYNIKEKQIRISKLLQEAYHIPATIDNFPDGLFAYSVIPEESRNIYRQMVKKVESGEDATTEMEIYFPSGDSCFVRFEWYVTRRKNEKVEEVVGMAVDISQEMAERSRIDKERRRILGGNKKLTGYSITDLQNNRIDEAQDYYLGSGITGGETREEFINRLVPYILTEKEKQRFKEMHSLDFISNQLKKGITEWTDDLRWMNLNGHLRWQRSSYNIIENNYTGNKYFYTYLYDVMEEVVMQDLSSGIQDNMFLKTGIISFITGQLYSIKGDFKNREVIISDYEKERKKYVSTEVVPEDADMVLEKNSLARIKKELYSGETDYSIVHRTRLNGKIGYYQIRFALVPEKEDICISVLRDITNIVEESEQKNEELRNALIAANDAAKAKSEFLSRMSHEIRTPMNAIMGMTLIAEDNKNDESQVSDCLSKIDSSSKYLLTLINDILDMSRIESGKTELSEGTFEFEDLIEQVYTMIEPLSKKSKIYLAFSNNTKNGSYLGDHVRIQQIMINLLGNAIKFTKEYGRVDFNVSVVNETKFATIFEFIVKDSGIGMSKDFMERMFEPFSQADSTTTSEYGGSGLGLAISKSLIETMGGTVKVESLVGNGTNFTVRIPLKKVQSNISMENEIDDQMSESQLDEILNGRHILLVEDHPLNVMVAKKLLERKGITVSVSENGKAGVETFNKANQGEFDSVLMDIRMPIMDGLEATRRIRALDREDAKTVPIIAMSANAYAEDVQKSFDAGMNEHLAKPVDSKILYHTLARFLMGN